MAYSIPLSSSQVKEILNTFGLKPKKQLGQNFLVDPRVLQKILLAAQIKQNDVVIEVGPGLGVLTQALAKNAKQVLVIEKDAAICQILEKSLERQGVANVTPINQDVLKFDHLKLIENCLPGQGKLKIKNFKVVANLPYYITSPVIRKFLETERKPELMVLMVQKEVAQRICAKPPYMSLLAVSVQFYAKPEIISYVKKTSFWPQPNVDSAILRVVPHNLAKPSYPQLGLAKFFTIVKAGFKQPRKQLLNNLSRGLNMPREATEQWLKKNNVLPTQRAETLSIEHWRNLAESLQ